MEFSADTKSLGQGDRVQALSAFREAELLEPADYRPHQRLSSIYSALELKRQANEESELALRLRTDLTGRRVKTNLARRFVGK